MLPFCRCGVLSAGLAETRVAGSFGGTYTALAGTAVRATVKLITAARHQEPGGPPWPESTLQGHVPS
nr:hypothetical protein GCM10020092_023540 [Actinoplanes digitatis]